MNPEQRLTAAAILEQLAAIAETRGFDIKTALDIEVSVPSMEDSNPSNGVKVPPPRPMQQPCSNNTPTEVFVLLILLIISLILIIIKTSLFGCLPSYIFISLFTDL